MGSWYQSTVNMRNFPRLYKIRKGPVLDPGATMNQQAGTGVWHCNATKKLRRIKTRKVRRSTTSTGMAAGAMMWRLLTGHLAQGIHQKPDFRQS
jgi:hypothetical protein